MEDNLHPQRCETCSYYKFEPMVEECMKCNHPDFIRDIHMHEIHGFEFDRIEKMGCASYSSNLKNNIIKQIITKNTEAVHDDCKTRIISEKIFCKVMATLVRDKQMNLAVELNEDSVTYFASSCNQKMADERKRTLERIFPIVRNVINLDQSGLAETIAKMRVVIDSYRWIPEREWGSYDYTQRTVETLQKEVGYLLTELDEIGSKGLQDSDKRVREYIKHVEEDIYGENNETSTTM